MSLEQTLERLAAAAEIIAAAIAGGKTGGATNTETKTAGTPAKTTTTAKTTPKKPTHTREELAAIAGTFREKTDKDQAKALIKDKGGVDKLADLPEGKIDALYAAFEAAIEAIDNASGSSDDDEPM